MRFSFLGFLDFVWEFGFMKMFNLRFYFLGLFLVFCLSVGGLGHLNGCVRALFIREDFFMFGVFW